ncbi:hypothetical protein [uncultured Thioclava sp.]|uniref:hypothetical protein n=1 Tax=uncultured Thioclava sp. TaxID=473858 RepID=UPI0025EE45AE|nr:hypothetical protein [uncultured Thioclava sp.]
MIGSNNNRKRSMLTGLSVAAIVAIIGGTSYFGSSYGFLGAANAEEGTSGSHTEGAGAGNKGGQGGHSDGQTGDDSGHTDTGGKKGPKNGANGLGDDGHGQGGPDADSEGKGPKAGSAGSTRSGKPVWSQEGLPEVELGRLNVARSPSHVLDRAYAEAMATLSPEMAAFYNQSLSDIVMSLSTNFDNQTYIDSPLQNLSMLRDALDGSISLPGVSNSNETLMAVFLGVASDKTVPISPDAVTAVSTILGAPVSPTEAARLAADAEAVRIAVLAGHG